jgi:hypothetical protein
MRELSVFEQASIRRGIVNENYVDFLKEAEETTIKKIQEACNDFKSVIKKYIEWGKQLVKEKNEISSGEIHDYIVNSAKKLLNLKTNNAPKDVLSNEASGIGGYLIQAQTQYINVKNSWGKDHIVTLDYKKAGKDLVNHFKIWLREIGGEDKENKLETLFEVVKILKQTSPNDFDENGLPKFN